MPRICNSPTKDTSNRCLAWGPHPQPNLLQVIPTTTRHSFLKAVWRVLPVALENSPLATHLPPNEESSRNKDAKLTRAKRVPSKVRLKEKVAYRRSNLTSTGSINAEPLELSATKPITQSCQFPTQIWLQLPPQVPKTAPKTDNFREIMGFWLKKDLISSERCKSLRDKYPQPYLKRVFWSQNNKLLLR